MVAERTDRALTRLDEALRRIESASIRAQQTLADRAQRDDRLRQAITETLRDLDGLINEGSQG